MHKCQCGKEFEGEYCPDCGTKWQEEKTCPKCGAKLNGSVKFCNECGYSFEEKKFNFLEWLKKHLKIVIPVALAIALIIILSCSIPACVKGQTNGTYYKLKSNGEIDQKTYFILKSGKWSDEEGESGTYKKNGEKITFYMTFFGETEEVTTGTLKDKVLTVNDDKYISEKHKHKYEEWETTKEPTCTEEGLKIRSCFCGVIESSIIEKSPHTCDDWEFDNLSHWKVCKVCKSVIDKQEHSEKHSCDVCSCYYYVYYGTINGYYSLTEFGKNSNIKHFVVPSTDNDLNVEGIAQQAFQNCKYLESITISEGIIFINPYAFLGCTALTTVYLPKSIIFIGQNIFDKCSSIRNIIYDGTIEEWKAIEKSSMWDWGFYAHKYTINCIDGNIDVNE